MNGKNTPENQGSWKWTGHCWTQFAAESAANQWKIELFFN